LIILAGITVVLGFGQSTLEHFLGIADAAAGHHTTHHWLLYAALTLAAAGVLLAWLEFGRRRAAKVGFVEKIPPLNDLFGNRWYLDRFYRRLLDTVVYGIISNLCVRNDNQVIDGGIDGFGRTLESGGRVLSRIHLSMIQYRLMIMFVVLALLAVYFFI
jgi:NADH-quinone oxidoreductase subunit L